MSSPCFRRFAAGRFPSPQSGTAPGILGDAACRTLAGNELHPARACRSKASRATRCVAIRAAAEGALRILGPHGAFLLPDSLRSPCAGPRRPGWSNATCSAASPPAPWPPSALVIFSASSSLAHGHLAHHAGDGDGRPATEGLELHVLQPVVLDLDVECHHVAADRVANLPDSVRVLDFAHVPRDCGSGPSLFRYTFTPSLVSDAPDRRPDPSGTSRKAATSRAGAGRSPAACPAAD